MSAPAAIGRGRVVALQVAVAATILVSDQLTKWLVASRLELHEGVPLVRGYIAITHVLNTGGVWGIGGDASPAVRTLVFLALPAAITAYAAWHSAHLPATARVRLVALALLVGGAVGNLLDRLRLGHVVDFMLVHWRDRWAWPAFNVADSAICVGIAILLVAAVREPDDATDDGDADADE